MEIFKDIFAVRYYKWAIQDSLREIESNFSLLSTIKSQNIFRFLEIVVSMPRSAQEELFLALIKRFHKRAVELTGETLSAVEKGLIHACDQARLVPASMNQKVFPDSNLNYSYSKSQREALADIFRKDWLRFCGGSVERFEVGELRCINGCDDWRIDTYMDFNGRYHRLSYEHRIVDDNHQVLSRGISLTSWLGISSQTNWDYIAREDMEQASQTVVKLGLHFIHSARNLLAELANNVR